MPFRRFAIPALAVLALALAASLPRIMVSAQERMKLGALDSNEGIYVSPKGFDIVKGAAKADPTAQIMKLGAQEVKEGAIIFRAGDKLYLVDTNPAAKSEYTGWAAEAFAGN